MTPHEVGDRVRAVVEDRNELLNLLTEVADADVIGWDGGDAVIELRGTTLEAIQRRVIQDRASA